MQMKDINLKTTRQMKIHKHRHSIVVTRGKGVGEVEKGKGVKYMMTKGNLTLGLNT